MKKLSLIIALLFLPSISNAILPDCERATVATAISSAIDNDTIECPAGEVTWATSVTLDKSITLKGAGSTSTIINSTGTAITVTGARVFTITGFKFVGTGSGQTTGFILNQTTSAGWRIHSNWFYNATGRSIYVGSDTNDVVSGLIDNNIFTQLVGVTQQGVSVTGAARHPEGFTARERNFLADMGTDNAVYIDNNTFNFYDRSDGALDTGGVARVVFRHNTVNGTNIGTHGTDSGFRLGPAYYEIYNNTFTGKGEGAASPLGAGYWIRGGTGVIYNNTISGTFNLSGCGAYWCFATYRAVGAESWSGACDGTDWKLNSPNTLSETGTYSFCSVTRDRPCTEEGNCPGGESCNTFFDENSANGYPCRGQVGVGPNQTSAPVYIWGNTYDTMGVGAGGTTYIENGRDVINDGTQMPGYTAYDYPHPRAGSVDVVPSAFSFGADVTGAELSTLTPSPDNVTVAGIDAGQTPAITVSGTGCEYAIDGAAFTADAGTVGLDNVVALHTTSSASHNATISCTVTIGGVSDSWGVRTGAESVPILISPSSGSGGISRPTTLTWGAVIGAILYNLQVATDREFTNVVVDVETENTSFEVNTLAPSTKYYWRVRAKR